MSEYLRKRDGYWHFVRRVPVEFEDLDKRRPVRQSTKIRVADDRGGSRAGVIAAQINKDLEAYWALLAAGRDGDATQQFDAMRHAARRHRFAYLTASEIADRPLPEIVARLDVRRDNPRDTAAILGLVDRPRILLSELFEKFETLTRDEVMKMSPNQLRVWRNGKMHAAKSLLDKIGDKSLTEITAGDVLDFREEWQGRVLDGEIDPGTANKVIGHLSRMFKVVNIGHRLGLPALFSGMRLAKSGEKSRPPFDPKYVQTKLLGGALSGLNEEARRVLYVVADTGMRPSEVVNLTPDTIHLKAKIPYVEVKPIGRVIKTEQSEREIPLVGAALAAMRRQPEGFPRYRDGGSSLSAAVNKFMRENNLLPTPQHSAYSLRHTFKDRLVNIEAPDALIDQIMGHKIHKPKYGRGPSLDVKLKWLQRIAFKPPSVI